MPVDWSVRDLRAGETGLLRTATLTNLNWTGEQRFTDQDLDEDPELRHYFAFDTARGDFGYVATSQNGAGRVEALGVTWLLFLDSTDPGYGFVADGVPELSVCVWSGYRGRGIGRALLLHARDQARQRNIQHISLSVEADNPAAHLYRDLGFSQVPGAPAGTMIVRL